MNKLKKISGLFLIIIIMFNILFSNIKIVFAAITSGSYAARIYETPYKDDTGHDIFKIRIQGDEIPALNESGFGQVTFCLNHHMNHPETYKKFNVSSDYTNNQEFVKSARLAYLGYYRYSNANGNASKSLTDRADNVQYAYAATLIWQNLGQVPNGFSLDNDYNSFKSTIMDEFNKWDVPPSFNGNTETFNIGETKVFSDSNEVLQYYESFDYEKDGVTFKHTKGSNNMEVSIDNNVTKGNVALTQADARNNNIGKYINDRTIKTNFVLTPPSNEGNYQRFLIGYGYNDPKYLRMNININLYGNMELSKKDNKGNYVPNTSFKISYNEDMSESIGTYTTGNNGRIKVEQLRPGTIYVQETAVPKHLILDTTIKSTTITPSQTTSFEATNAWKQGRIQVIKKDKETNKIVRKAGTKFDIFNSNNKKIDSITTNDEGIAISSLLDYGTYYVREVTAPNKYTVKVEVSENIGVVENGKTYEITILNTRVKGSISISKEDTKTGKQAQGEATLKGAIYGLYARNPILDPADGSKIYSADSKIGELTTNDQAIATIENLYLGEYYIKEIAPSKGYTLDNTRYDVDLTYTNQNVAIVTKSVTVKERVISQAFQIIKISNNEGGEVELLPNSEFTIKAQKDIEKYGSWEDAPIAKNANGETASILVTDSKGYAISDRLAYGTYIIRETKVPEDKYRVEDFKVVISQDSNEPQTWRIFNDISFKSILAIVKKDIQTEKTVKVEGATFRIKNLDTGKYFGYWNWNPFPHYVDAWTTDETGTVMTGNKLEVGNYQLEEQKSPKGYLISSTPVQFRITSKVAYETLPDGKTPVITVKQKDAPVKGKINIEKRGEVLIDFRDGKFIYEEKGLPNAKYEIFARENIMNPSNDGTIIHKKGTIVDTITTNLEGKATSKELPLGEYSVREVKAPEGMVINNEVKNVSLVYKNQNTPIVYDKASFVNERQKVDINVTKKDTDEDIGLLGAEFALYAKENIVNNNGDIVVDKGQLIETVTSDENGKVHFELDLPLSSFEIREIRAPIGYASSNEIINVDATYKGQNIPTIHLEYEFKNEIIKVEISKQDITNSEEIEGAHLIIFEKSNEGAIFDTWISGQDGKNDDGTIKPHLIKGLELKKIYVLKEISSPYGFALTQDIEFTVEDTGKIQKIIMKDELRYGELRFNKYGKIFNEIEENNTEFGKTKAPVWNESNLLGAEITIYAAEDIKIGNNTYYKQDEEVETLESDWESVTSKKLPVGNYYYIESKVPHGYIADNEKHYFTVEDKQVNKLQVIESSLYNNRAKVNIDMTKILEEQKIFENKDAYKDIKFAIFAREDIYDYMGNVAIESGNLIAVTGITKEGHIENTPDLPNGVYYIKELQTNNQYILNDKEYDFEIGYKGKDITEYNITIGEKGIIDNKLARGIIQVRKVDILNESKKLENIEFNISSKKDMTKILKKEKTNSEGIATFEDLELGTYYIQEASQIDGYVLNDIIYQIELQRNGDILVINCENKPTEMTFSKVDETGTNELEGAKIQIIDKETNKIIEEWISTKEPHIIYYLIDGKEYIMKEITAPRGYHLTEEITFIAGDNVKVVMQNLPILKTVIQTGNETNYMLLGILTVSSIIGIVMGIILLRKDYDKR